MAQSSDAATALDVVSGVDGNASRVIAAIFEPVKSVDQ
jgi:hypothetical protein